MKVHPTITAWLSVLGSLHAGPPLLTDDPFTPGPGKWEINIACVSEREAHDWLLSLPVVDINYGLGERGQFKFKMPYLLQHAAGREVSAWGNSEVGLKWRFFESSEKLWFASLYPQVSLSLGSASLRRGLTDSRCSVSLPVEVAWRRDAWTVYAEAGWQEIESEADVWFVGCAAEYEVMKGLVLLGELRSEVDGSADDAVHLFNIGTKKALSKQATLLASAGRSLSGSGPEFLAYLGLQLSF